jgi:RecJ-like exonuclease
MYKTTPIAVALLVAGCSSEPEDLRPFVAVAMKYSLMAEGKPAPAISTDCMNCRGTGKVGDGRVMSTCPVCNGTGKVTPATQPAAAAPPCKDGTCPPKAITSR